MVAVALARLLPRSPAQRVLTAGTLVNNIGNGIFIAAAPFYFTRVVGLSAARFGAGLSIAAVVGLSAGVPVGHWADRFGARRVHMATMAGGGAAMAGFEFVRSFWPFVLVAVVSAMVAPAAQASRAPLIRAFGQDNPARFRAYLRSVTNLGLAFGALAAGFGIAAGSRDVYRALVAANGITYLANVAVLIRLPDPPPAGPAGQPRLSILAAARDRPYLTVAGLNAVVSLHYCVPTFALPLWLAGDTHAPRWLISVLLLLNTGIVVVFQVRASRAVNTGRAAARRMAWAGAALLAATVTMSAAAGRPAWPAALILLAGMGLYTVGEMWQAAAAFELSFGLAPARAQGQYAGLFGLGPSLAQAAGPTLLSLLCLQWRVPGWWVLGAVMSAAAVSARWAVSYALSSRAALAHPPPGQSPSDKSPPGQAPPGAAATGPSAA